MVFRKGTPRDYNPSAGGFSIASKEDVNKVNEFKERYPFQTTMYFVQGNKLRTSNTKIGKVDSGFHLLNLNAHFDADENEDPQVASLIAFTFLLRRNVLR